MPLALYRRHRRGCKAGHGEDLRTSEYDERKKGWKRCECPILASGTLSGKFKRQATGQWEWVPARAMAAAWETAGSWGKPSPAAPQQEPERPNRIPITDALQAYLAKCQNRSIQPSTLSKYRTFCNQLTSYVEHRGFVYLDQLSVSEMDLFYASWKDGIRAKAKKLERLKSFVKFCLKRKWLAEDISSDLQAPEGSSVNIPKAPFTDEELSRIHAACDEIGGPVKAGPGYRTWGGEDVRDFIYLSIYTGLRISDVATFDIDKRLEGNNVFLRMHKTRQPLFTYIPTWLVDRLHGRRAQNGSLIFRAGTTLNAKQLCDIWRNKRLKKVFELAGPWSDVPTPHRMRHTFVRILLEKGVPVADVAELIGDTPEIVAKHYSRWISTRQLRLTNILKEAFEDKPKKLIAIDGRR